MANHIITVINNIIEAYMCTPAYMDNYHSDSMYVFAPLEQQSLTSTLDLVSLVSSGIVYSAGISSYCGGRREGGREGGSE